MDHKAFLKDLPADTKAALTAKSDGPGLVHLSGHLALVLMLGGLIAVGVPGWWVLVPLQGVVLVFLFTLEHETTHKTPFANEALNEAVGRFCGLVILVPFTWFRYFHLAHHRYTHDPERDPELVNGAKPESWVAYLWFVSGLPYWGRLLHNFAQLLVGRDFADYIPVTAQPRIRREMRAMAVIYALALVSLAFSPVLFWVWLLPMVLGQPALRLYLLAEHGRCAHVANMFANTRTIFTMAIVRWLAWNMPYHAEHHAMPSVPFHKLPDLHDLTAQHLQQTENGYGRYHRRYVDGFGG